MLYYMHSMPARSTRCSNPFHTPPTHPLCRRFPGRILLTERHCGSERCDFRDCEGMRYSLIDMMNLARTRLILGSGTAPPPLRPNPALLLLLPCPPLAPALCARTQKRARNLGHTV